MKRLVLLTVLLLVAVPAFAQVAFNVTSLPRQVRGEGITETLGDVLLVAANGGTVLAGSTINIVYAAPVTAAGTTGAVAGDNVLAAQGGFLLLANLSTALNGNQITISFTANTPFVAGQGFTIGNIRADATGFSSGAQITAFISGVSINPALNPITFTQPSVTVGLVTKPSYTGTGVTTAGVAPVVLTCNGAGGGNAVAKITEVFPSAFTSRTDETTFTPNIPAASITNGSLFQVTVSGVPNGVRVTLTPTVVNSSTGAATGTVAVVSKTAATSTGNIGTILGGGASANTGTSANFADQIFTIAFTGTTATATTEDLILTFNVAVPTPPATQLSNPPATITATVALVPTISGAMVRFTSSALISGTTVGSVGNCVSALLFPFVASNAASFDTSIAIANTTKDVFGVGVTAAAQGGTCTITGFPSTESVDANGQINGVTAGTAVAFTTPTIPSGGTYSTSLGSRPATDFGAGFVGYAFAVCNFLNAHGFAFITDNFGIGAPRISHGYNALVLNPNATRVIVNGESLGQ